NAGGKRIADAADPLKGYEVPADGGPSLQPHPLMQPPAGPSTGPTWKARTLDNRSHGSSGRGSRVVNGTVELKSANTALRIGSGRVDQVEMMPAKSGSETLAAPDSAPSDHSDVMRPIPDSVSGDVGHAAGHVVGPVAGTDCTGVLSAADRPTVNRTVVRVEPGP